jgi:hypothetical protein
MNTPTSAFVTRTVVVILAVVVFLVCVAPARAGITGDLFVHNFRDETVTVKVLKTDGTYVEQEMDAQTTSTIYIGDNEIGATWIYYADSNGTEIDRVPAWEAHKDYHLEIY